MGKCLITKLNGNVKSELPYIGYVRRKATDGEGCSKIWVGAMESPFKIIGGYFGTSESSTSGTSEQKQIGGWIYPSIKGMLLIPKYEPSEAIWESTQLYTQDLDSFCKIDKLVFTDDDVYNLLGLDMPNLTFINLQNTNGTFSLDNLAKYPHLKGSNFGFGPRFYSSLFTDITTKLPNLEVIAFGNATDSTMPIRTSDMPVLVATGSGALKGIQLSDSNILAYFKNQANCKAGDFGKTRPIKIAADPSKVTSIDGLRAAIDVIKAKGYTVQFNETTV